MITVQAVIPVIDTATTLRRLLLLVNIEGQHRPLESIATMDRLATMHLLVTSRLLALPEIMMTTDQEVGRRSRHRLEDIILLKYLLVTLLAAMSQLLVSTTAVRTGSLVLLQKDFLLMLLLQGRVLLLDLLLGLVMNTSALLQGSNASL